MTLDHLPKNTLAIITQINIEQVPLKLVEMGCIPGNNIEILQIAPLKDPLYIKVNDSFLSIRKDLAQHIQVEKI